MSARVYEYQGIEDMGPQRYADLDAPPRNAFGQPIRPQTAAQRQRAAAWAPFATTPPAPAKHATTKGQPR